MEQKPQNSSQQEQIDKQKQLLAANQARAMEMILRMMKDNDCVRVVIGETNREGK